MTFRSKWKLSQWTLESTQSSRSNKDMDPVPVNLRTWTTWNYASYWISDALNPTMWEVASSMIAIGLSWKQALVATFLAHVFIAAVIILNGTMGARLHVPFPVIARTSFGFYFSYVCILMRMLVAMFWFGIQTYIGSECTYQMLKALIGPPFTRIPNHLPESTGITTTGMLCFLVFWLLQFPFLLVSPRNIRHLFVVKAVLVPATCIAMLVWAMVHAPPKVSLYNPSLSGKNISGWAWMSALNSAVSAWSTLSINIPDFTRYAINEKAQLIQILVIPVAITLVGFCGIAVAAASETLYGSIIWDPLQVMDRWDSRAASFFAAFSFTLAVLATNIGANSLSAANDMTAIMPRYINIRRGQVICGILGGWILCPWKILASAPGFLSFMSAYSIFLGPLAVIMVVDYWIVRHCKVNIEQLYNPTGKYRYWHGINWRAATAFFLAFVPNLPGLIARLDPAVKVGNMQDIFDMGWFYGSSAAALVYWILSRLFPPKETLDEPDSGCDCDEVK